MSAAIESLVEQFESRKMSRRQLVASLTALVTSAASAASAQTQAPTVGLLAQGRSLNHASLTVTDAELANPGTINHICVGVDNFDADRMAARCKEMGITASVDRNPANRTSGGDQLYIQALDNHRFQTGPHGYQG